MNRRRLSKQQARRIESAQRRQATDARLPNDNGAPTDAPGSRMGVVLSRLGKFADVADPGQPGEVVRCHIRANVESVVTGDRVLWRREAGRGVILAVDPRRTELRRHAEGVRGRALVANVDRLIVVVAPLPPAHPNLMDRHIVAAEDAGLQSMVVLNKSDLADDTHHALLARYAALGFPTFRVSARTGDGIALLLAALQGSTSAFVGQSGVGKSALIGALAPHESVRTGALSGGIAKGQHTTTAARLYRIADATWLIDSPGIREFSLDRIEARRLAAAFREFRPLLGGCRFSDCRHRDEPGCAIRAAVESGTLDAIRYASYLRILGDAST